MDDTRELLENVPYAPVRGRYKVYLIDEVHMFSGHSFNALLKTLEEPPPHVKFLLATTDPQKVPVTVLSRCLQFNLKRLPVEQIEGQFRHILEAEQVASEPAALACWRVRPTAACAMASVCWTRRSPSAVARSTVPRCGPCSVWLPRSVCREMIAAAQRGEAAAVMAEIEAMSEHAPDFAGLLREVVTLLHRTAVLQQVPAAHRPAGVTSNAWADWPRRSHRKSCSFFTRSP